MTFKKWLENQEQRVDMVGDIAQDAKYDKDFPRCGSTTGLDALKRRHKRHLDEHRACADAYKAMDRALEEYDRTRASSGSTQALSVSAAL